MLETSEASDSQVDEHDKERHSSLRVKSDREHVSEIFLTKKDITGVENVFQIKNEIPFTEQQLIFSQEAINFNSIASSAAREIESVFPSDKAELLTHDASSVHLIQITSTGGDFVGGNLWQVVPSSNPEEFATVIAYNPSQASSIEINDEKIDDETKAAIISGTQVVDMVPVTADQKCLPSFLAPPPPMSKSTMTLWISLLQDSQKIGESYRGWVATESELDLLLTLHKQQTQSFWGTRQSPSPARPSTRLMWKSQYVPFDGMPFINAGSRAIVMECQFGPRRKGNQKKSSDQNLQYKTSCPARIYIKKVKKFPEFQVDVNEDKKMMSLAMNRAFSELKLYEKNDFVGLGEERFYVQLPTEVAHEFHTESSDGDSEEPHRLHPLVTQKVREMVATGETRLYVIRKALRKYVEKDLSGDDQALIIEKHNLSLFPTVNDLQNHIHRAVDDLNCGKLTSVQAMEALNDSIKPEFSSENENAAGPHPETVTVTLTQNTTDGGPHMVSRVETHLSDGSTQVSAHLTPETAELLTKLHPSIFPSGSIVQVQESNDNVLAEVFENPIISCSELCDDSHVMITDVSSESENQDLHNVNSCDSAEDNDHKIDSYINSDTLCAESGQSNFYDLIQSGNGQVVQIQYTSASIKNN